MAEDQAELDEHAARSAKQPSIEAESWSHTVASIADRFRDRVDAATFSSLLAALVAARPELSAAAHREAEASRLDVRRLSNESEALTRAAATTRGEIDGLNDRRAQLEKVLTELARQIAEAEKAGARIIDASRAEAETLVVAARAERDQVLDEARAQAAALVTQSEIDAATAVRSTLVAARSALDRMLVRLDAAIEDRAGRQAPEVADIAGADG